MKPTPNTSTADAVIFEAASERVDITPRAQDSVDRPNQEPALAMQLAEQLPENVTEKHRSAYSPEALVAKLAKLGGRGGFELMNRVLQLYYLARTPDIPIWVKGMVVAALGYFIVTPDAVPDITPVVGFVDDLGVLATTLAAVASYISPKIKQRAAERLKE